MKAQIRNLLGVVLLVLTGVEQIAAQNSNFVYSATLTAGPGSVVTTDVNGDGKPDLICANGNANTLGIFTNNGSGSFVFAGTVVVNTNPAWIQTADVNGDGYPDLLTSSGSQPTLVVATNNGSGDFVSNATYTIPSQAYYFAAADIDGNGKPDLVVAAYSGSGELTVLTNDGAGNFAASWTVGGISYPHSVSIADFNGDGKPDIALAEYYASRQMGIYTNAGNGQFSLAENIGVSGACFDAVAADFNGDGKPDLAVADSSSANVTVLTNNGSGGFALRGNYSAGGSQNYLTAADMNGDGKIDIIATLYPGTNAVILTNDGTGRFVVETALPAGLNPDSAAVADFNGDGLPDVAISSANTNTITIYLAANSSSPVDLWHLDEVSGATAVDSAGPYPGTLYNSPAWVSGVSSNALDFNGNNQYVGLNSGPILGSDSNFTIEAWVKPDNNSSYGFWEVYCEGNSSSIAIELALENNFNGTYYPLFATGFDGPSAIGPALAVNEWHHLAAVLEAGVGGILYVDGQPVATNASMDAASIVATATDLADYGPAGARYYGGTIDEVQLFNTARTAAQVLADYRRYTPPLPPPSADLAIGEIGSPNPVGVNSNATFTITVTNLGPDMANDVIVSNNFGPDFAGVSLVYMSQGTPTNSQTVYTLGSLASNATATIVFTAIAESPSSNAVNACTVQSSADDPDLTNNTASASLAIVAPPPAITTQPLSQTLSSGGALTLSVSASGYSPLSYQWQFDGTNIDGATGSSLVLTNASLTDGGEYSVIASDAEGSVTSTVAVVTLINLQVYAGITISGPVGTNYEVDYRTDLGNTNWTELTNFALPSDPYLFIDTTSQGINRRFYRVLEN